MTEVVRPYRGVSAEERRSDRRARLIEACLSVVGTEGVVGTTVDRVCAEANLTKRYFYESFTDLEALLLASADEMFAELFSGMAAATHGAEPGQNSAKVAVRSVVTALAANPQHARLYVESPGHSALRTRRDQAIDAFAEFVATHVVTTDRNSPGLMLRVRLIVAGATDLITGMLSGAVDADASDVVEAVVRVSVDL